MARLPTPGGDDGTWGGVLNDFLNVAHNPDGSLKSTAVGSSSPQASTTSPGTVQLTGDLGGTATSPEVRRIRGHQVAATTPAVNQVLKFNGTQWEPQNEAGGAADATTVSKGVIQLSGDLAGTATSPQIAAGVIVDADVNASANIAQSKINNLTTDLAAKAADASVVHNTGNETVAGIKTFSSAPVVPDDSFAQSKVVNLTTDLAGKADTTHTHGQADITNLTSDLAAKVDESTVTSKGDLLAATGAGAITRLGVGSDNQVLVADSAETTGLRWGNTPAPADATTTTKGIVQLAGDLDGTAASPTVTAAGGLKTSSTTVSTTAASAPASGQFLRASNGTTASWQAMPRMFGWYLDGILVVGDGQGPIYRIDADVNILGCDVSCKVAPVTTDATFDIEVSNSPNGVFTTIFSVQPSITASQNIGSGGTLSTTQLTAGQYVRFNVDAVGGTAAQGVTAQLRMETR